jgi:GT2 family glycosyltransferase
MFVPYDSEAPIHLAVVALGTHDRMRACIANLVNHASAHDFTVTCVINPTTRDDPEDLTGFPDGVRIVAPDLNVGWAGGLHVARRGSGGELFGWIQDDVQVLPGWLDAVVSAAAAHPEVGAFGSLGVDADGAASGHNGGFAEPPEETLLWGRTDTVAKNPPTTLTFFDWVPSRGLMTRMRTWDQVGGADIRLYPLDMVDKDYCSHVRVHGWRVALVPDATLQHQGSQSAPRAFRRMINRWNAPHFDRRWGHVIGAVPSTLGQQRVHECSPWVDASEPPVEAIVGQIASRMLVPFGREASGFAAQADALELQLRELRHEREVMKAQLVAVQSSPWWRLTATPRAAVHALKSRGSRR